MLTSAALDHHRQHFLALANKTYFNYGGQGPMPESALEAIQQAHRQWQTQGPFSGGVNRWMMQEAAVLRQQMAQQLQVPESTIALTEDVTVGCNIPLWGIAWQPGDHILLSDCEHPGVIAAVQEVCRRFGVTMSTCPLLATVNGGDPVAVVAEHLQPKTRLVVISHIFWNTGQVLPLKAITALCHAHSPQPIWVLSDAAQSVGVLPLNLTDLGVDFYAFTGHKWWCGPAGLGGLYVRPEVMEQLQPTFIGWRGIATDEQGNPTGWKPNAERYEVATSDFALVAGLGTAIALHDQWGTAEQRYQRICALSQQLWQGLQAIPSLRCVRQTSPDSGLVAFQVWVNGAPSPQQHRQLVQTLEAQGVMLRTLLHPHCVRACVHYLTLEAEVDQLVESIQASLGELQRVT